MCTILNNQIYAEWAAAGGTILLAIITVIIHFFGDSYTNLIKSIATLSFKRDAFNFLNLSFGSWRPQDQSPADPQQTVVQNIDNFARRLIESKIYFSCCDKRRFKKYINLAREYAEAWNRWPGNGNEVNQLQRKIIQEMTNLAPEIGEEAQIQRLRRENPNLFN